MSPWGFESLHPHLSHGRARRCRLRGAMADQETVLVHPNREKRSSKATKATVTMLLIVSAALIAVVLIGGWTQMGGAEPFAILWVIVYAILAYYVARWSRGPLALAAGLAIFFAVIAMVAAPAWFARAETAFDEPLLPAALLGLLTVVLVPVQILLVVFSMRAFNQEWNVEVEVTKEEAERGTYRKEYADEDGDGASPGRDAESEERTEDVQATSPDRGPDRSDEHEQGAGSGGGADAQDQSGDEGSGTGPESQGAVSGEERTG